LLSCFLLCCCAVQLCIHGSLLVFVQTRQRQCRQPRSAPGCPSRKP
jgi:hypothetical protein